LPKCIEVLHSVRTKVPNQWCLRDCHIGNFLFDGNLVSGVIDLGTAGIDSISRDLSRLVGSIATRDQNCWRDCIDAYEMRRVLSIDELQLVFAFHLSGVIGTAANWLRWRFMDHLPGLDAESTEERLVRVSSQLNAQDNTQAIFSTLLRQKE
jgi:hypothetical protein